MKGTQNVSETHHNMLCQFLPKTVILSYSLNMVEEQVHGTICMQISRPVDAGKQLMEKLLHPMSALVTS